MMVFQSPSLPPGCHHLLLCLLCTVAFNLQCSLAFLTFCSWIWSSSMLSQCQWRPTWCQWQGYIVHQSRSGQGGHKHGLLLTMRTSSAEGFQVDARSRWIQCILVREPKWGLSITPVFTCTNAHSADQLCPRLVGFACLVWWPMHALLSFQIGHLVAWSTDQPNDFYVAEWVSRPKNQLFFPVWGRDYWKRCGAVTGAKSLWKVYFLHQVHLSQHLHKCHI